jgi:transposase-like protein
MTTTCRGTVAWAASASEQPDCGYENSLPSMSRNCSSSAGSRSTTSLVYRRVLRFTPLLADAARPCRHRVGDRWSVDETYVKVGGRWRYVYRAIDQFGQVIDVYVSPRRDATAAHRFVERAIGATKVAPLERSLLTRRRPI